MVVQRVDKYLYALFRQLNSEVAGEDDQAFLIGYAIVHSLISFSSSSGSVEERKFEEVKRIYAGLEHVVEQCARPTIDSVVGYATLSELKARADPALQRYFSNPVTTSIGESRLLKGLMDDLSKRPLTYEDRIRRKGLNLMEGVRSQGRMDGRRNILLTDYRLLESYFVEGRAR